MPWPTAASMQLDAHNPPFPRLCQEHAVGAAAHDLDSIKYIPWQIVHLPVALCIRAGYCIMAPQLALRTQWILAAVIKRWAVLPAAAAACAGTAALRVAKLQQHEETHGTTAFAEFPCTSSLDCSYLVLLNSKPTDTHSDTHKSDSCSAASQSAQQPSLVVTAGLKLRSLRKILVQAHVVKLALPITHKMLCFRSCWPYQVALLAVGRAASKLLMASGSALPAHGASQKQVAPLLAGAFPGALCHSGADLC